MLRETQSPTVDISFYATNFSIRERILVGILVGLTVAVIVIISICCQFQVFGFVTAAIVSLSISTCIWVVGFFIRYLMNFLILKDLPRLKILQKIIPEQQETSFLSSYFSQISLTASDPEVSETEEPFIVLPVAFRKDVLEKNHRLDSIKVDALERLVDDFVEKEVKEIYRYILSLRKENNKDLLSEELSNFLYPNRSSKVFAPIAKFVLQIFQDYSLIDFIYLCLLKPSVLSKINLLLKNWGFNTGIFKAGGFDVVYLLQMINVYLHGWLISSELSPTEICNCLCEFFPQFNKDNILLHIESGNILGFLLSTCFEGDLKQDLKDIGIVDLNILAVNNLVPKGESELNFLNSSDYLSENSGQREAFDNFKKLIYPKISNLPEPGFLFTGRLLNKWSLISEIGTICTNHQELIKNNPFLLLEVLYESQELQIFVRGIITTFIMPIADLEKILLPLILGGACFGLVTNKEVIKFLERSTNMSLEDIQDAIREKNILKTLFPKIFVD